MAIRTCFKLLKLSASGGDMIVALRQYWITKSKLLLHGSISLVHGNILESKLGFTLDEPQL